jgi:hypothetical protein
MKLSIILFLCRVRASSSNILIGYHAPSYLFSSPMDFCRAWHGRSCNGSIGLSPNFLYPNLVRDMHEENKRRADRFDTTDPDLGVERTN